VTPLYKLQGWPSKVNITLQNTLNISITPPLNMFVGSSFVI
jgi:hypothetical protein